MKFTKETIILLIASVLAGSTLYVLSKNFLSKRARNEGALPTSNSPEESIQRLQKSNERYVGGKSVNPRRSRNLRLELSTNQHPDAIVLSCSDSRVPPEVVFDEGLGELFVIRTAGHVVDESVMASIEYGIDHLQANLVIVLGHESCGAVQTALTLPPGAATGSSHLDYLISVIRENLNQNKITNSHDPLAVDAVKAQIKGTINTLLKESKILRERVEKGTLKIVPAIYHIDDGHVVFLTKDSEKPSTKK